MKVINQSINHSLITNVERRSTETGDGVDAEDDAVFVAERADAVDGMRHGGRGFAVREEEEGRMVLLQRRFDFVQTESFAVRLGQTPDVAAHPASTKTARLRRLR